jgi:hypothetical protein
MTIPKAPCEGAGFVAGDRLRVRAEGPGRILLERIRPEENEADPERAPV